MTAKRYIDPFDFREPVLVGRPPIHVGWHMDWEAYHAECDKRDREEADDNQTDH